MGFSDELRKKAAHIWEKEKEHPFVRGIGDGSLPLEKFRYYLCQDYVFLIDFCRAIALAAAKARRLEDMSWFARLLHETLNTEMDLHRGFCQEFGISPKDLEATIPSLATRAYTQHLVQVGFLGSLGEIVSALLPCSWGYCEIGQNLAAGGVPEGQPLYGRWIQMYASEEFAALARWMRDLIDGIAEESGGEERRRMEEAFLISSRHEYHFWDACYRMEGWPV